MNNKESLELGKKWIEKEEELKKIREENSKYIIAFDFDGTITKYNEYPHVGVLRRGIVKCMKDLKHMGFKIIIHTCRSTNTLDQLFAYNTMVNCLIENGIPFDSINKNINFPFEPGKVFANIYVDDQNLGWNNSITGEELFVQIINRINELKERKNCNRV